MCARKTRKPREKPCSDHDAVLEVYPPPKKEKEPEDPIMKLYMSLIGCELFAVLVASGLTTAVYYAQLLRTIVWSQLFTNCLIVVVMITSDEKGVPVVYEMMHHLVACVLQTISFFFILETIFFSFGSFLLTCLVLGMLAMSYMFLSLLLPKDSDSENSDRNANITKPVRSRRIKGGWVEAKYASTKSREGPAVATPENV